RKAEDLGAAAARPREPEKELHGGRLAGAVRTEEPEHRAARDGHAEAGEGLHLAVPLGETARPDRGRVGAAQWSEFATARICDSVSVPATPNTMPSFCQMTALPSPVESPTNTPGAPCTVTFFDVAMSTGIGMGSVLEGSLIARICAASCGVTPGCARRYCWSCSTVTPSDRTMGPLPCATTSLGSVANGSPV